MEGDQAILLRQLAGGYFNPLPPHGGRQTRKVFQLNLFDISIHSLRMEGDGFLVCAIFYRHFISIHSLRMEGDKE